jgi:hypothetical protein
MKFDQAIAEAIRRGVIRVDCESGRIYNASDRELRGESRNGYRVLELALDGTRVRCRWHRVVWIAAHGSVPSDQSVCHRDNDKTNNGIANLYLATHAENIRDAAASGRMYGFLAASKVSAIHAMRSAGYSIERICTAADVARPTVLRALRQTAI